LIIVPRHVILYLANRGLSFLGSRLYSFREFVDYLQARGVLSQLEAYTGDLSHVQ